MVTDSQKNDQVVGSGAPPPDQWGWYLWATARIRCHIRGCFPWMDEIWQKNPDMLIGLVGELMELTAMAADPDLDPLDDDRIDPVIRTHIRHNFFRNPSRRAHHWVEAYGRIENDPNVSSKRKYLVYLLACGMSQTRLARLYKITKFSVRDRLEFLKHPAAT